jgi:uncharacterized coiled-coil protein SlyX
VSDFGLPCPNCGQKKKSGGKCCAEQITYLKRRLASQSKVIEKLEDALDRGTERAVDKAHQALADLSAQFADQFDH